MPKAKKKPVKKPVKINPKGLLKSVKKRNDILKRALEWE